MLIDELIRYQPLGIGGLVKMFKDLPEQYSEQMLRDGDIDTLRWILDHIPMNEEWILDLIYRVLKER